MKTITIQCDVCYKEYNEDRLNYISVYKIENGSTSGRMDLCPDCAKKLFEYLDADYPTEKGGEE